MDELDVKIFRALAAEGAIASSDSQVLHSIREIARTLGSDDMTVRNRYKKLQEAGCMSVWRLVVNPAFFGYKAVSLRIGVLPESAKPDMIRKLRLIHGVVSIIDHHGPSLRILLLYDSEESRSRAIELISRITNAENMSAVRMSGPSSETKRLTETDIAIIRALAMDARKPYVTVAKELGLSSKTVKNRLEKLSRERTLMAIPEVAIGDVEGLIPVMISYSYANGGAKASVDNTMIAHFDANFLWGVFSDPEQAYVVLSASTIGETRRFLTWAKEQPGIATAELDIAVECLNFPEMMGELLTSRRPEQLAT